MRVGTRSVRELAAVGAIAALIGGAGAGAGCAAAPPESRGATYARYAGATQVVFTNASPARMCGLYMSADDEPDYGDNWLPREGLASGASIELRVRPGKYKARWDTCPTPASRTYFAATLWRELAVIVDEQQTQLYAYVADRVAPTKRAQVMGRDWRVVRFAGQPVDREPPPLRARPQQVALRAASAAAAPDEPPPIAGFVGRMPLSAEQVAARPPVLERFDAREFVDARPRRPAPAARAARPAPAATPAATTPAAGARPAAAPSLDRRYELADRAIEYRKR